MAATAANGVSITTSITDLFVPATSIGCTSFAVHCTTGSSFSVLVNVEGLHAAADFYAVHAGETVIFRNGVGQIKTVTAKGSGGTATVDYGVVARL